ncbi:unnamed protein product [Leuciscus chuanchicus]
MSGAPAGAVFERVCLEQNELVEILLGYISPLYCCGSDFQKLLLREYLGTGGLSTRQTGHQYLKRNSLRRKREPTEGPHCDPNGRVSMVKKHGGSHSDSETESPHGTRTEGSHCDSTGRAPAAFRRREPSPMFINREFNSVIKMGEPTQQVERESLRCIWIGEPTRRFRWETPLQEWYVTHI